LQLAQPIYNKSKSSLTFEEILAPGSSQTIPRDPFQNWNLESRILLGLSNKPFQLTLAIVTEGSFDRPHGDYVTSWRKEVCHR
jgi:hypothetical protein